MTDQSNADRYVALWSRWPDGGWIRHVDRRLRYYRTVYPACRETGQWIQDGREYRLFERGVDPNDG
jgi:hypothetical protein